MKINFITLFVMELCVLGSLQAQPNYINRNSNPGNFSIYDKAQKAVNLGPNFEFTAGNSKTYTAVIGVDPYNNPGGNISLNWPKAGQIYQRRNDNKGWIYIEGHCDDLAVNSVRINAYVVQGGQNKSKTLWVDNNGDYKGALLLNGGDYAIEAKILYHNGNYTPVGNATSVARVGVGEVLIAYGHSFMQGENESKPATDPRSRSVYSSIHDPNYQYFPDFNALPKSFSQINNHVGPMNDYSWMFGILADTLVQRLGVPVLILSSAFGGSSVDQNYKNINNIPFGYPWFDHPNLENAGFPYRGLKASIFGYAVHTGFRGLLLHHGVNDQSLDQNTFQNYYQALINQIRNVDAQYTVMPILMARDVHVYTHINAAIDNIISNDPNIFPGIDLTNLATVGPWRDNDYAFQSGHFIGQSGLMKYFEFWKQAIPNSFFQNTPYKEANIDNSLKN